MVVKMGRPVTSQIAFKSLAVGWVGWVGWGGWSEPDNNATLSSVSQSVSQDECSNISNPAEMGILDPAIMGEIFDLIRILWMTKMEIYYPILLHIFIC